MKICQLQEKIWIDDKPPQAPGDGPRKRVFLIKDEVLEIQLNELLSNSRYDIDFYGVSKRSGWEIADDGTLELDGTRTFNSRLLAQSIGIDVDTAFIAMAKNEKSIVVVSALGGSISTSAWSIVKRCAHAIFSSSDLLWQPIKRNIMRLEGLIEELYSINREDRALISGICLQMLKKKKDAEDHTIERLALELDVSDWAMDVVVSSIVDRATFKQFPKSIAVGERTVRANISEIDRFNRLIPELQAELNAQVWASMDKCRGRTAVMS